MLKLVKNAKVSANALIQMSCDEVYEFENTKYKINDTIVMIGFKIKNKVTLQQILVIFFWI